MTARSPRFKIADLTQHIRQTLATVQGVNNTQAGDTMHESLGMLPTLQVYWDTLTTDPTSAGTDRTTFQARLRQSDIVINADLYVTERGQLSRDVAKTEALLDAVCEVLDLQSTKPYFGNDAIQAFTYTADRTIFIWNDPEVRYSGIRFALSLRVF